ncbi:hemoglobin subunit alpha-D-like [Podarcis lilfordi]|uniref:Hemoglobin subunit alpha-D-like n=1 Tax=Podarcis lilfordi TaxID=74358 RepID=A0AA35L8I1_9SAUR|nr:hemoglobin subunit alpha-D-like [Podarcis lilfordi]
MKLTAEECKLIKSCWSKLAPEREDIGGEAMTRLFQVYTQSKIYFSHFDLCPGSNDIHHHGQKIFKALDRVINNLENIRGALSELSDLHAYNLRVDPVNFKFLTRCLHVTMASSLRVEYTAVAYLAFDKLLCEVSDVLTEKYR